jgi:hypothetical protein
MGNMLEKPTTMVVLAMTAYVVSCRPAPLSLRQVASQQHVLLLQAAPQAKH